MSRKSVLITGCSEGGIGHSLALEWSSKNFQVYATARSLRSMATLKSAGIECFEMDVTKPDTVQAVKDQVAEKTGGTLDILVNNAGQGYTMPILDTDLNVAKQVFDVNFFGVIGTIQAFAPLLIAAEGTIVIIGSAGGVFPYPFGGIYGATKSSAHYLADVLRLEMHPFNVKVINVATGGVKSQIASNATKNYDHSLPPNSLYLPIEDEFKQSQNNRLDKFVDTKEYARYVVSRVNKATRSGWLWKGRFSTTIWFVSTFLWKTVLDSIQLSETGLKKLRGIVTKRKVQ